MLGVIFYEECSKSLLFGRIELYRYFTWDIVHCLAWVGYMTYQVLTLMQSSDDWWSLSRHFSIACH